MPLGKFIAFDVQPQGFVSSGFIAPDKVRNDVF